MTDDQMKAAIDAFGEAMRRTGTSMQLAGMYCAWRDNPDAAKLRLDQVAAGELRNVQAFAEWLRAAVPAAAGRLLADTARQSGRATRGVTTPNDLDDART